jgi:hypothetical protein
MSDTKTFTVFNPVIGKQMDMADVDPAHWSATAEYYHEQLLADINKSATFIADAVGEMALRSGVIAPAVMRRVASILAERTADLDPELSAALADLFT